MKLVFTKGSGEFDFMEVFRPYQDMTQGQPMGLSVSLKAAS